jgi:hypothetical protein
MEPSTIAEWHKVAMDWAEVAEIAHQSGNLLVAKSRLKDAYFCEREAADLCLTQFAPEPTRSVIHRSAASLAIQCGEWVEAYHLVAAALVGPERSPILKELVELKRQIVAHWREVQE